MDGAIESSCEALHVRARCCPSARGPQLWRPMGAGERRACGQAYRRGQIPCCHCTGPILRSSGALGGLSARRCPTRQPAEACLLSSLPRRRQAHAAPKAAPLPGAAAARAAAGSLAGRGSGSRMLRSRRLAAEPLQRLELRLRTLLAQRLQPASQLGPEGWHRTVAGGESRGRACLRCAAPASGGASPTGCSAAAETAPVPRAR
jgi:hypothetical protein